jgi:hypothetical protein
MAVIITNPGMIQFESLDEEKRDAYFPVNIYSIRISYNGYKRIDLASAIVVSIS